MRQNRNEHAVAETDQKVGAEVRAACLDPVEHRRAIVPGIGEGHFSPQRRWRRWLMDSDAIARQQEHARHRRSRFVDSEHENARLITHGSGFWQERARDELPSKI
jgi:hypothetical protein